MVKQTQKPGPAGGNVSAVKRPGKSLRAAVRSWFSYYGGLLLSLLCLIAVWFIAAHAVDDSFRFPMIEDILGQIAYALTDVHVWSSLYITMRRVAVGVFWGAVIGFPLGVAMGFSKIIMYTIAPFINSLRQIPTMCWVPLAVVWFGLGDGPTIFIIAFSAVFVVILNVIAGVQEISPDFYNAVRSMGASSKDVMLDVVLPGCTPGLITGIRMALSGAWMTVM